jgi:hypothetical protein
MPTLSILTLLTVTCSTTTQSKVLHFHSNKCYKNMPQYNVQCTLLILLVINYVHLTQHTCKYINPIYGYMF